MPIIREPFTLLDIERHERGDRPDTMNVRLNDQEYAMLQEAKKMLRQPKDSTALKQLAVLGYAYVAHDKKMAVALELLFNNERKNERLGVVDFD